VVFFGVNSAYQNLRLNSVDPDDRQWDLVGPLRTSMLQDLEKGRQLEVDALLTAVQEMGRLVDLQTPHIDSVLALIQQLGRTQGLYPVFPEDSGSPESLIVD